MTNELNIVLEILDDAADELRLWLAHPQFPQEQRGRLEVLMAQMEALRCELETPMLTSRWLEVRCDSCRRGYTRCRCPVGESMVRYA